jgi:hypothetical protein
MPKYRKGVCVFCGHDGDVTDDHVPPQCLFGSPLPDNLVEVPGCKSCNQGSHMDDEYLKTVLAMRDDLHDHPIVEKILPSVTRGLLRPKFPGLGRRIARSMKARRRFTPSGLYGGIVHTYDVDLRRIGRVLSRTVKGLFFNEFGRPLPTDYEAVAYLEDGLGGVAKKDLDWLRNACRIAQCEPGRSIGDQVFSLLAEGDGRGSECELLGHGVLRKGLGHRADRPEGSHAATSMTPRPEPEEIWSDVAGPRTRRDSQILLQYGGDAVDRVASQPGDVGHGPAPGTPKVLRRNPTLQGIANRS